MESMLPEMQVWDDGKDFPYPSCRKRGLSGQKWKLFPESPSSKKMIFFKKEDKESNGELTRNP